MNLFVRNLKQIVILLTVALLCVSCKSLPSTSFNPWKTLTLSTESTFADVAFTDDLNHGWLVGGELQGTPYPQGHLPPVRRRGVPLFRGETRIANHLRLPKTRWGALAESARSRDAQLCIDQISLS